MMPQSPEEQATSHAHELGQVTLPQASAVEQVTSQRPEPHVTLPHAVAPMHFTVQLDAVEQSTLPHGSAVVHVMVQSKPAGHAVLPLGFVIVHVWGVAVRSHDAHSIGHVPEPPENTQ
jgi:hypothetical protein